MGSTTLSLLYWKQIMRFSWKVVMIDISRCSWDRAASARTDAVALPVLKGTVRIFQEPARKFRWISRAENFNAAAADSRGNYIRHQHAACQQQHRGVLDQFCQCAIRIFLSLTLKWIKRNHLGAYRYRQHKAIKITFAQRC